MQTDFEVSRSSHRVASLMAGLLLGASPAMAQRNAVDPGAAAATGAPAPVANAGGEAEQDRVMTRVYDVRDMLVVLKHYPFRGVMMSARQTPAAAAYDGGAGTVTVAPNPPTKAPVAGEAAPAPAPAPQAPSPETVPERTDSILQLIQESVAPDSWRDAGGSIGSIRMLSGHMVVTQTAENHRLIQQLFSQLRETRGKMVRVRAHWLLMASPQADKLFATPGVAGGAGAGGAAGGGRGDAAQEPALVPVDPTALRNLPQDVMQFHAQTVGYNTQTVHVVSGPARTVVSDVDAQVGTGVAAFDPVVELVRSGLVLEVTPLIAADNRYAVLDLYSAFVDTTRNGTPIPVRAFAASQPARGGAGDAIPGEAGVERGTTLADGVVDRLSTTMQEMRTTLQLPLNKPVLVGGMTIAPSLNGQPSPQLYLVVEVVASE